MIKFRCPHCDQKIRVSSKHAGKKAKCPQCRLGLEVPSSIGGVLSQYEELREDEDASHGSRIELIDTDREHSGDTKACPKCGHQLGKRARICVNCGHSFKDGKRVRTEVERSNAGSRQAPGLGVWVTAGVVLVLVAGGVVVGVVMLMGL